MFAFTQTEHLKYAVLYDFSRERERKKCILGLNNTQKIFPKSLPELILLIKMLVDLSVCVIFQ